MPKSTIKKEPTLEKKSNKISTEYKALQKSINNFQICQRNWNSDRLKEALKKSLTFNKKLWEIFRLDCENKNCTLPDPVRKNLLSLERFINRYSDEIKKNPFPEKLDTLIAINKNIAIGFKNAQGSRT